MLNAANNAAVSVGDLGHYRRGRSLHRHVHVPSYNGGGGGSGDGDGGAVGAALDDTAAESALLQHDAPLSRTSDRQQAPSHAAVDVWWHKWLVLSASCFVMFGNYYAYDLPASLHQPLKSYMNVTEAAYQWELNAWYSAYSLPNIVLPAVAGLAIDYFVRRDGERAGVRPQVHGSPSLRRAVLILSSLVCLGQLLYTAGLFSRTPGRGNAVPITISLLGRCLFGVGGESLGVAQSTFTARWFSQPYASSSSSSSSSSYLALAMGLNLAVGRFGSVLNDFVSPRLAVTEAGVPAAMWAGTAMCTLSMAACMLLCLMDASWPAPSSALPTGTLRREHCSDRDLTIDVDDSKAADVSPVTITVAERVRQLFRDIAALPRAFGVVCSILVLTYGTVIPFNAIHAGFLQYRYGMPPVQAAEVMAIPDTISMVLTPFTGGVVDAFGHRPLVLFTCSTLLASVHLLLGWLGSGHTTWLLPYGPLLVLGLVYACQLIFWPIIPLIVPRELTATAYGIASAILNTALTLFPMLVSALLSLDPTYTATETLFLVCGVTASIMSVYLARLDRLRLGGALSRGNKTVATAYESLPDDAGIPLSALHI